MKTLKQIVDRAYQQQLISNEQYKHDLNVIKYYDMEDFITDVKQGCQLIGVLRNCYDKEDIDNGLTSNCIKHYC